MTDRKIEKVFTYDLNQLKTVKDSNNVNYDPNLEVKSVISFGKNIFVYTAACVHKFQWIGEEAGHDYNMLEYDELNYNKIVKPVYMSSIKIPNGVGHLNRAVSNTYITNTYYNWSSFTRMHNNTGVQTVFSTPVPMISNIAVDNNFVFCVGAAPTDQGLSTNDLNRLYIWNALTLTWASVEIPVKKQVTKCQLTPGNDGYIYITNFNNFSVTRFSNVNGSFDQTFRTNGYPMTICGIPDRGVMSGSYAGMLTKIDGDTGEVFNSHSTIDPAIQLVPQGEDYIWFLKLDGEGEIKDDDVEGNNSGKVKVCRLKRSDNEVLIFGDDIELDIGTPLSIDVSKPFKYKQFNGTDWYEVNAIPHLFIVDDTNKLSMIKLDKFVMVEHELKIESYSMISTGPQDYMGEIAQGDS